MKQVIALSILAATSVIYGSPSANMIIVWQKVQAVAMSGQAPAWTSYVKPVYDPASRTTLWYNARSTSSLIYSTDMFSYNSSSRTWTRLGGTGSTVNTGCGNGSTATDLSGNTLSAWPSDRHPIQQFAIDTSRNALHMVNGVCSTVVPYDHWVYALNAAPTANRWQRHLAGASSVPSIHVSGALEYSVPEDVLVMHGTDSGSFPRTWVFCPGSGAPTSTQASAGCQVLGAWFETYRPTTTDPPGSYFTNTVADPTTRAIFHFAGASTVWSYDVVARRWRNRNPTNAPTEPPTWSAPERNVTRVSTGALAGRIYYRQTSHSTVTNTYGDHLYDPVTSTWSSMASAGIGPRQLVYLAFDPTMGNDGGVVAFSYDGGLWHGTFMPEGTVITTPFAPKNPRIIRGLSD